MCDASHDGGCLCGYGCTAGNGCRSNGDDAPPDEVLTVIAGGHVFAGTWDELTRLQVVRCAACEEELEGFMDRLHETDGAGVQHPIMCTGWPPGAPGGRLMAVMRGAILDDDGDGKARGLVGALGFVLVEKADDLDVQLVDPIDGPAARSAFAVMRGAFDAVCRALDDRAHAVQLAMDHDARVAREGSK